MKKSPPKPLEETTGVIKIRLGMCLTGPTNRMLKDLWEIGTQCCRAQTAMVRAWERWREDHPDWEPDQVARVKTSEDGSEVRAPLFFKGRPLLQNDPLPRDQESRDRYFGGKAPETWLYHVGTRQCPEVSADLISQCSQLVWKSLKAKCPHNHEGISAYRWQAVLNLEDGRPEVDRQIYRQRTIAVPSAGLILGYGRTAGLPPDVAAGGKGSPGIVARVRNYAASSCVIRFPLFSNKSGRLVKDVICRLEVRQLSGGNRELLRRLASQTPGWEIGGSKLVYRESSGRQRKGRGRGAWFLHLTYTQPQKGFTLNPNRKAVLEMLPGDGPAPFRISAPESPTWTAGKSEAAVYFSKHLADRKRYLQRTYRDRPGANGYGRGRMFRDTKPLTAEQRNLADRYQRQVVADIVRYMRRFNCGVLVFKMPSMFVRNKSWFESNDLHWDWTQFESKLKHQRVKHGMVIEEPAVVRKAKPRAVRGKKR